MVKGGDLVDGEGAAEEAHFGIGGGEDDAAEAGHDGGAAAHGARFFGDVEGAFVEAPVAEACGGGGDGEDFGVGGGVVEGFDAVVGGGDGGIAVGDDGADGDFVGLPGLESLVVGEGHEILVIATEFGGEALGEGAGEHGSEERFEFFEVIEGEEAGVMAIAEMELDSVAADDVPAGDADAGEGGGAGAAEAAAEEVGLAGVFGAGGLGAEEFHGEVGFGAIGPADGDFVAEEGDLLGGGHGIIMGLKWREDTLTTRMKCEITMLVMVMATAAALGACGGVPTGQHEPKPPMSLEELRKKLTPEQFRIAYENGTEPPFRNRYYDNKRAGIYVDIVTGRPLFSSKDKFDSGTGWPSFTRPIEAKEVTEHRDVSHGMIRTEVRSASSDAHLGHVFDDGPKPTGLRYCINSAVLRFVPVEDLEKEGYGEYLRLFKE